MGSSPGPARVGLTGWKSGALRSLHQFVSEKGVPLAVRFDTNKPSRQRVTTRVRSRSGEIDVSYELISLPLYAVGELDRLLDGLV